MANVDHDWKSKYLDLLDDLEKAQQLEKKRLEVLRKGVVRVSIAADGQDETLDNDLAELRAAMRGHREVLEIEPLIYKLENTVKSLDARRKQDSDGIDKLLDAQVERYLALPLSRGEKKILKKFRKEYPSLLTGKGGQAALWRGFAEVADSIIAHYQAQLAVNEADKPKGFLQWLFGRRTPPPTETALSPPPSQAAVSTGPSVVPESVEEAHSPERPRESVEFEPAMDLSLAMEVMDEGRLEIPLLGELNLDDGSEAPPVFLGKEEEIQWRIRSIIRQLFDITEMSAALAPRRDRLLARIDDEYGWEDLPDILTETSELVVAARVAIQKEFEAFLLAMHQRLEEVQGALLSARQAEAEALQHQEALHAGVRDEFNHFREALDENKSLPEIRHDIESMMGRILGAIDNFRDLETVRREALFEQVQTIMTHVESMDQDSAGLRKQLEQQREHVLLDALTGLPNRHAYDQEILSDFDVWQQKGNPLSMVLVDIDFFRAINDTLGHSRGDKVLKLVGREIRKRIRKRDFVARYGYESFVLIMRDVDEAAARTVMETVRRYVEACPFNFNNERLVVTVSAGIAAFAASDTPDSVFLRADRARANARQQGGNRVLCASMSEMAEE